VTSGERLYESWARCNPDGSWVKTSPASSLPNLEDSSGEWSMTWCRWGIGWDGLVMGLKTLEPFIVESEFLLLPTPRANQAMAVDLQSNYAQNHKHKNLEVVLGKELVEATGESGTLAPSSTRPVLNPEFVERMMGFPIGWSDLNVSETP